jgi:hypothetical protein
MSTAQGALKYFVYQPRYELLEAISRLIEVVDYNLNDSGFFDLRKNIENMIYPDEARLIIDFIGYKIELDDIQLLIDELQQLTDVFLSPQNVLFLMMAPVEHIEDQLNVDKKTAIALYNRVHLYLMCDDSMGFIKELLLGVGNRKSYAHKFMPYNLVSKH